ncbi:hypothetical protein [Vibrio nigripulchritudo]|uniref:hypothetical protein n=1 Tax=Vibrio nigripulchritudo TaxID=28173 RepID=UPI0005F9ABDA|nr:hypothetical protein [Vibrio nigripulchritudo]KJY66762.1 hypothetical protein TW74_27610 [Vibrio nigripulchritudo]
MRLTGTSLLFALLSFPVLSEDWSFSGFGNVGYSYDTSDSFGYMRDLTQKADPDSNGSFLPDSKFGAQVNYNINYEWDVSAQYVIAERAGNNALDGLELAFLAYRPNPDLDIRLGRLGYNVFWFAETRRVDYGHLWVRLPQEIYSWIPLQNIDGADITYRFYVDDISFSAAFQYGSTQATTDLQEGYEPNRFYSNSALSLSLVANWDVWRTRISYAQLRVDSGFPEQVNVMRNGLTNVGNSGLGPISREANELNAGLDIIGSMVRYGQIGLEYNDGNWQVLSELVKVKTDKPVLPAGQGGYITVGKRFDTVTPYLTRSWFKPSTDTLQAQNDWSVLPDPQLAQLQNAAITSINATRIDQSVWSLGARWDVTNQISLKAQVDWVHISENGHGLWATRLLEPKPDTRAQVYSLSASFLF